MQNLKECFEKELKFKLSQKSASGQSEEAILVKCFKYFDLNNSGTVSRDEFIKSVEKIGINTSLNKQSFYEIFNLYDKNKDGQLDYKEFSAVLSNNMTSFSRYQQTTQNQFYKSQKYDKSLDTNNNVNYDRPSVQGVIKQNYNIPQDVRQYDFESTMLFIKNSIASRSIKGFLGIQRQLNILDDDQDQLITYSDFQKSLRNFQIDLTDQQLDILYERFSNQSYDRINIDSFMQSLVGNMNQYRLNVVQKVYKRMDKSQDNQLNIRDIKGLFTAKYHPAVKSKQKTEDELLCEFNETFDTHHNMLVGPKNLIVTEQEFVHYYNIVSSLCQSDDQFEEILMNSYKLNNILQPQIPSQFSRGGLKIDPSVEVRSRTTANAPYGTFNIPNDYQTYGRPSTRNGQLNSVNPSPYASTRKC